MTDKNRILVVEDSSTQRSIYKALLEEKGYAVVEASDGEEGLKKAMEGHLDVIITDMSMPKMDGLEMIKVLKKDERTKFIPIICISATYQDIEMKIKALMEAGAEEYFYAPQSAEELAIKVAVMIRIRKIYIDLMNTNRQLKTINDACIDRELKMIELKKKIKSLEDELAKYKN